MKQLLTIDERHWRMAIAHPGPMAQLGILPQFGQNPFSGYLVVIEILSISCSVLLSVKADGYHLAVPNYKKNFQMT